MHEGVIKNRKIGIIFLIETFYKGALDIDKRQQITDKTSMMYVSHIQENTSKKDEIHPKVIDKPMPPTKYSGCG